MVCLSPAIVSAIKSETTIRVIRLATDAIFQRLANKFCGRFIQALSSARFSFVWQYRLSTIATVELRAHPNITTA